MPSLQDQTTLQEVFKRILAAERQGIDPWEKLPIALVEQQCPLTSALVGELLAVGAEGEIGSLITMLLASAAEPTIVVHLVQEACQED
ncbi:MAG: hypothetical protein O9326_08885 [Microcystis sp. LE19-338.1B]|nr:hypothetical protein [Microcystis sp. LE19-338.1B]MCZ8360609.1 hypothetical protein [Microcystis sp. LE19-388.1G]